VQNRGPALGTPINKFRSTKNAVVVLLVDMRKIAATWAEAVLVIDWNVAWQRHLCKDFGMVVYDIASKIPRAKPAAVRGGDSREGGTS